MSHIISFQHKETYYVTFMNINCQNRALSQHFPRESIFDSANARIYSNNWRSVFLQRRRRRPDLNVGYLASWSPLTERYCMCAVLYVINGQFAKNRASERGVDSAAWSISRGNVPQTHQTITTRCFLLLPIDCFTSRPIDTNMVCSPGHQFAKRRMREKF